MKAVPTNAVLAPTGGSLILGKRRNSNAPPAWSRKENSLRDQLINVGANRNTH